MEREYLRDFDSPAEMFKFYGVKRTDEKAQKILGQYILGLITYFELKMKLWAMGGNN